MLGRILVYMCNNMHRSLWLQSAVAQRSNAGHTAATILCNRFFGRLHTFLRCTSVLGFLVLAGGSLVLEEPSSLSAAPPPTGAPSAPSGACWTPGTPGTPGTIIPGIIITGAAALPAWVHGGVLFVRGRLRREVIAKNAPRPARPG